MSDDKILSQAESKRVADFLRQMHSIESSHGLFFWRRTPSWVSKWLKDGFNVELSTAVIAEAAGRIVFNGQA